MRILRGLSSRVLPCGCLTGVYETYDNEIVGIVDSQGSSCADASHQAGQALELDTEPVGGPPQGPPDRRLPSA